MLDHPAEHSEHRVATDAAQRQLGLDVLPVSNGGRVVHVYETGRTFVTGRLEDDPEELRGVKDGLQIRSKLGAPLVVAGARRGMLMLASLKPDYFTDDDVRFAETVARWTATVAHRAQIVEEITRNAAAQGRQGAAEELITVLAHDLRNLMAPLDTRLHRCTVEQRLIAERTISRICMVPSRRSHGFVASCPTSSTSPGSTGPVPRRGATGGRRGPRRRRRRRVHRSYPPDQRSSRGTRPAGHRRRRRSLRPCVENLLANAIQKSPKDAGVDVLVRSEIGDTGEWAVVDVIDQGPGVPEHLLPHIFNRYVSGTRREGGLGLYLARQIAMMHGGDLTVESSPGSGARFTLMLPCVSSRRGAAD